MLHARRSVGGRIASDPLRVLPLGSNINFKLVEFGDSNATQRPNSVGNWDFFKGAITSLALKSQTSQELVGTAIIVAPGLAISASHNLGSVIAAMEQGQVVPYCFGVRDKQLEIWKVNKVSYCEKSDIALLSIEAASEVPEDRTYYRLGISTRTPIVGEPVHIVGFRSGRATNASTNDFGADLFTSVGEVAAVYPEGRDKLLLPFPAIELHCGSLGGMSGGAALDKNGLVIGIISRGLEADDGHGPTYLSWILNGLDREIEIPWPPGLHKGSVSPLSMDGRLLFIDRREALAKNAEGQLEYTTWFE